MNEFAEYFEHIFFTEANYGRPVISESTMTIKVRNLPLMGGHPLSAQGVQSIHGFLVFQGVFFSRRAVTEYIGNPMNPDGFREEYFLEDISVPEGFREQGRLYRFEGVQEEPPAWVDWDVEAISFKLIVDEIVSGK